MLSGFVILLNLDYEVGCFNFILYLTAHLVAQIFHIFITIFICCKKPEECSPFRLPPF